MVILSVSFGTQLSLKLARRGRSDHVQCQSTTLLESVTTEKKRLLQMVGGPGMTILWTWIYFQEVPMYSTRMRWCILWTTNTDQ
jgi:hypothetical protein